MPGTPHPKKAGKPRKPPLTVIMYCDGASRGNPGPASVGVLAYVEKMVGTSGTASEPLFEIAETIGAATNNVAEYKALVYALQKLIGLAAKQTKLKGCSVCVRMDSELVVKQMLGQYKVKHENLKPLHKQAAALFSGFSPRKIEHVRREQNKEADALANHALDQA